MKSVGSDENRTKVKRNMNQRMNERRSDREREKGERHSPCNLVKEKDVEKQKSTTEWEHTDSMAKTKKQQQFVQIEMLN